MQTNLSKNLIALRELSGLSQLQVALAMGVTKNAYQAWEARGIEPRVKHLLMLATFYGITVDELLRSQDAAPKVQPDPENKSIPLTEQASIAGFKFSDEEITNMAIKVVSNDGGLSSLRSFSFTEIADFGIDKYCQGFKAAIGVLISQSTVKRSEKSIDSFCTI